jgi:hypothetical protein
VNPVVVPQVCRNRRAAKHFDKPAGIRAHHGNRVGRIDADPSLEEQEAVRMELFDLAEHIRDARHPILVNPMHRMSHAFEGVRRLTLRRPGLLEVPQERDPQRLYEKGVGLA